MTKQLTVRGVTVNQTVINAYAKRINSFDDIITVWANAATLQAAAHANRNWLDQLFALPTMRIKSGDLSANGKQVLGYIQAHCPRVLFNKETCELGLKKFNPDSPLATHFVAFGVEAEDFAKLATEATDDTPNSVVDIKGKYYSVHGDFRLTFAEYKAFMDKGEEKDDSPKSILATAAAKQMEKFLEAQADGRLIGSADDLVALLARAKELISALDKAHTDALLAEQALATAELAKLAPEEQSVDVAKADELLKSGQAGKSKRAPKPMVEGVIADKAVA